MAESHRGPHARVLPAVDDRLVMPGTRYEILEGEVHYVAPGKFPHASSHSRLSAVLEAFVANGYLVTSDMLTRTSEMTDIAPDASVLPADPDMVTGGRRLEELAFEVVTAKTRSYAGRKARALMMRGVRRVFAIDVDRKRMLSWSLETDGWEVMPSDGVLEDRALHLALPISVLLGAARMDDAISRAMLAKKTPAIREALAKSKARGKAEAVLEILSRRNIRVTAAQSRVILGTKDETKLSGWLDAALTCTHAAELGLQSTRKRRAKKRR